MRRARARARTPVHLISFAVSELITQTDTLITTGNLSGSAISAECEPRRPSPRKRRPRCPPRRRPDDVGSRGVAVACGPRNAPCASGKQANCSQAYRLLICLGRDSQCSFPLFHVDIFPGTQILLLEEKA